MTMFVLQQNGKRNDSKWNPKFQNVNCKFEMKKERHVRILRKSNQNCLRFFNNAQSLERIHFNPEKMPICYTESILY